MDEQKPAEIVELRVSSRYVTEHPWVVQAIGGFLSAYFMEQPEFRVQRHREEPESGAYLWICEVPATMKVQRLLKRLKEDIPPARPSRWRPISRRHPAISSIALSKSNHPVIGFPNIDFLQLHNSPVASPFKEWYTFLCIGN